MSATPDSSTPAPRPQPAPRPALVTQAGALAVLAGAALLRFWHLGARSLWTDEGSTWAAAKAPFGEMVRLCAQKDASPPLFYWLTSLALRLGDSEAHLRLVSALASIGLVWITYRLVRLATGRGEALLAATLAALSPFQLLYAQEARTYTLVAFFTVASFYLFLRAAVFGRRRTWLPYIVVSALGLYTQDIAMLGLLAQGAVVILVPEARRRFAPWLLAQLAVGVVYLPWLFESLAQVSRLHSSHWYMERPNPHSVYQVLRTVFVAPIPLATTTPLSRLPGLDALMPDRLAQLALLALPLGPLALAAPRLLERGPRGLVARACALAMVLPVFAVLVVSFHMPLWSYRYFVFLTPFIAVLTAAGLGTIRPAAIGRAWAGLLLLLSAYACLRVDLEVTKEPWRDVVHAIAEESAGRHAAVLVTFDLDPFRFYDVKLARPIDAFEVSHPAVPFASYYTPRQIDEMEQSAREHTRDYEEVWVVIRSPNSAVRREVARRAERVAAEGRALVGYRRWDSTGGPIRVAHFRRLPAGAPARPDSTGRSRARG